MKKVRKFAIIVQLGKKCKVILMNRKINVLGVQIDNYTAKDAMRNAVQYLETDLISTVGILKVNTLISAGEVEELKDAVENLDMVVAGDEAILEAAGVTERKRIQEVQNQMFLKMLMRYMHKNRKRVFLLTESEEEADMFKRYLATNYGGIVVSGELVLNEESEQLDDWIVNTINGLEIDCILASLSTSIQEPFIMRNRTLVNARLWLGLGKSVKLQSSKGIQTGFFKELIDKRIFKRKIEKHKKEM